MKKLAIVLIGLTFLACSKEEKTVEPRTVAPVTTVSSILNQSVNGTVTTDHSYKIDIFEDMGNGNFQKTTTNEYTLSSYPFIYNDEITRPFYFSVVLHNSSTFSNGGKGNLNVSITYKGDSVLFLEVDSNTWSEIYTSPIYNN
jgi:hypothetical protein